MKKIISCAVCALLLLYTVPAMSQKTKAPVKKNTTQRKLSGPELSIISITITHNGETKELNNKQFETWGGTTIPNGVGKAIILNYGASNSKQNDNSFSWMFTIPKAEKGIYTVNEHEEGEPATSLQFSTTLFPKVALFLCKSGSITIEDCPLKGGFVKGNFAVVCVGGVTADGLLDESEYNISGQFSILRQ